MEYVELAAEIILIVMLWYTIAVVMDFRREYRSRADVFDAFVEQLDGIVDTMKDGSANNKEAAELFAKLKNDFDMTWDSKATRDRVLKDHKVMARVLDRIEGKLTTALESRER